MSSIAKITFISKGILYGITSILPMRYSQTKGCGWIVHVQAVVCQSVVVIVGCSLTSNCISNVFNYYFVDVTADIGNPDNVDAGHVVSDITGVYSNPKSVRYVRNNCLQTVL